MNNQILHLLYVQWEMNDYCNAYGQVISGIQLNPQGLYTHTQDYFYMCDGLAGSDYEPMLLSFLASDRELKQHTPWGSVLISSWPFTYISEIYLQPSVLLYLSLCLLKSYANRSKGIWFVIFPWVFLFPLKILHGLQSLKGAILVNTMINVGVGVGVVLSTYYMSS